MANSSTSPTLATTNDWRPALTRLLLLLHFLIFGVVVGVKGVVWAEVLRVLSIGEGLFGSAQLLPSLVSMVILFRYSRLIRWASPRVLAHKVGTEDPDLIRSAKFLAEPTMEAAFARASEKLGDNLDVLIVPHALLTLPIVER